ncbi:MAG: cation diffusion facilitator family transporter, partial [Alphaproteobacteria bacterium]|nr:cation diffusion facilitator family transporter [Alphaproteobacteria bacterium]
SMVGIGVMVFSIAVTLGLVLYQRHVVRVTASAAVKADAVHYEMDVLSNLAVILAIVLATFFGWHWADPLFALVIAGYILYGAWKVGHAAFQNLMDREFSDAERGEIYAAVRAVEGVKAARNLRTRRSGVLAFIQVTVDVDGALSLKDAHDINDAVEEVVYALYPDAEIHIHTEPV